MPQAGAHAIIAMYLNRVLPNRKWFYAALIFGAMLPDIDTFAAGVGILITDIQNPVDFFHRKATHSFFFAIVVFIFGLILSEFTKKSKYRVIAGGLSIGIVSHIFADTFFFFKGIYFLWPLNFEFNLWTGIYTPPNIVENLLLALEFLFFRIYAWILIQFLLQNPTDNLWLIKPLTIWKNIELWCFIIFTILAVLNYSGFLIIFGGLYLVSLLIALSVTVIARDIFQ